MHLLKQNEISAVNGGVAVTVAVIVGAFIGGYIYGRITKKEPAPKVPTPNPGSQTA
jgi:lactobin A/cerein 7B family class IIb bacteriocin